MEENLPEPDPWKPLENVEASLGMLNRLVVEF